MPEAVAEPASSERGDPDVAAQDKKPWQMNDSAGTQLIPVEQVEVLIHLVRGERVLLDSDLAALYGVSTGALNRAVRRNANRFPTDFMFQLTAEEADNLKCQSGISSSGHDGTPTNPRKQIGFQVKEARVPYGVKRKRP
jgi:hypothetical protein